MKPTTIDEYLAHVPEDQRDALERLRRLIHQTVPRAVEYISYGLPAFRLDDRPLVAFGAAARHCSFYPMSTKTIEDHRAELSRFSTSKGTIRFQPDAPLPAALVRKLVQSRVAENEARRT